MSESGETALRTRNMSVQILSNNNWITWALWSGLSMETTTLASFDLMIMEVPCLLKTELFPGFHVSGGMGADYYSYNFCDNFCIGP